MIDRMQRTSSCGELLSLPAIEAALNESMALGGGDQYPLSDGVMGWRSDDRALVSTRHHAPSSSLLARYLHATGQFGSLDGAWPQGHADVPLLARLTEYLPRVPLGADSWCVAHVRAGDAIDCDVRSLADLIAGPIAGISRFRVTAGCAERMVTQVNRQRQRYVKPVAYYVRALEAQNCTSVLLLAHAHFSPVGANRHDALQQPSAEGGILRMPSIRKSVGYLGALGAALCARGVNVTLRTNGGTDADFAVMVRARAFVSGGGGYSKLATIARAERARMRGSKRTIAEMAQVHALQSLAR